MTVRAAVRAEVQETMRKEIDPLKERMTRIEVELAYLRKQEGK